MTNARQILRGFVAIGLNKLEPPPPPIVLEVQGNEEDVAYLPNVTRLLPEKVIKGAGYIWKFHKNDADDWPSPLHGHDYEQGLKLDAITGDIFDVATRQKCATLKAKHLKEIHSALRNCKGLSERAAEHLLEPSASAANDGGASNEPDAE